jgi:hypothetical protein
MNNIRVAIFIIFIFTGIGSAGAATIIVPAAEEGRPVSLQAVIDAATCGDTLILDEGVFSAEPLSFIDSLCGNCEEHATLVEATTGFVIRNKGLVIAGSGIGRTILVTNAGYGIYFEGSWDSELHGVTVTGGSRDPDGNATDAGIVVRRSNVTVRECGITDNTSRIDTVVVGIGGIFGREGAELYLFDNEIRSNGWDGIALYRGATAVIRGNMIDAGRGAGIGITWDAVALVSRNTITGFWKGIGTFGDSRAVVSGNIVHDCLGWGIIATGTSMLDASNNIVHHNGNCGLAIWSGTCWARFTNNIVTSNGWREEWVCPCVGVWMIGPNPNAEFSYNNIWGNEAGEYANLEDLTGINGNISVDPRYSGDGSFSLTAGSPLIDAGNPLITDTDGSRSDIGLGPGSHPPISEE